MRESKNGREEAAAKNNHGTYYDVQVASYAMFLGDNDLAKNVLEEARHKRIATQVEPDGRQPLELARTRAWSYSVGNLDGLITLAEFGERLGVDLWNFRTSDGRGIRPALEFLYPFAVGDRHWTYQQINGWQPGILFPLMRRAAGRYKDNQFKSLMQKIPPAEVAGRESLLRR